MSLDKYARSLSAFSCLRREGGFVDYGFVDHVVGRTTMEALSDELLLKILASIKDAKDVFSCSAISRRILALVWQVTHECQIHVELFSQE